MPPYYSMSSVTDLGISLSPLFCKSFSQKVLIFPFWKCHWDRRLKPPQRWMTTTLTISYSLIEVVAHGFRAWARRQAPPLDHLGGSESRRQRVRTGGGPEGGRSFESGLSSWPVRNGTHLFTGSTKTALDWKRPMGMGNSTMILWVTHWTSTRGWGKTTIWMRIIWAATSRADMLQFQLQLSRRWIWGRTRQCSRDWHDGNRGGFNVDLSSDAGGESQGGKSKLQSTVIDWLFLFL